MAVFISYSHEDREVVDRIAANLVRRRVNVWVDRWELRIGDSLIQRIQSEIQSADALVVMLSRASVRSAWCQKELSAGLIRELEERRVVVLPVLLEECEIPLFLRDKKYADFRRGFDHGLSDLLEGIASASSIVMGRLEDPEYFSDWAVDWGLRDGKVALRWTVVDHGKALPYCVITEIEFLGNEQATRRFEMFEGEGLGWFQRAVLLEGVLAGVVQVDRGRLLLTHNSPETTTIHYRDTGSSGIEYDVRVTARWLGTDTGKSVVVHWLSHLERIRDWTRRQVPRLTAEETVRLQGLLARGR
jgi:TIR domain